MRILILTNYFYPEIGAAPSRIYNMANGLKNCKHDIEVIAPLPNYPTGKIFKKYLKKLYNIEYINNIKTYQYYIYPSTSINSISRLFSMCSFALSFWLSVFHLKNKKSIDCVIIQNSPLLVSFSGVFLFKKILKRRIVLNVSDLWPGSAVDLGVLKEGFTFNILKKIEHYNYKNSDSILGQSSDIINEIKLFVNKPFFIYRNLQPNVEIKNKTNNKRRRILYAGLLGVAQDVLSILKNINFVEINMDFHIYGDGNQKEEIVKLISNSKITNVKYLGLLPKEELLSKLINYDFSIAPLKIHIRGAVPSKIFECINNNIPIVYLGGGEAAEIINTHKIGYVLNSSDFNGLEKLLIEISNIPAEDYLNLVNNCNKAKLEIFNFEKQINDLNYFLHEE